MEIIVLIPGLICAFVIFRHGTAKAMLNVFLPVVLLGPIYFFWNARPLPPISAVAAMLLAMGVGMLFLDIRRWKFTRTDLWMAVFLFSVFYADYLKGRTTNAIFLLFDGVTLGLIPYMAGKLLIEQTGNRIPFAKRYVMILAWSAGFSAIEYVAKTNPYIKLYGHFFPGQWGGSTQVRWGFGRVSGAFGQSEMAGMMVLAGVLLALWLGYQSYGEKASKKPLLKRYKLILCTLVGLQFVTQARGPWIGAVLAVAVASVGRAKRPLQRAFIVAFFLLAVGLPTYLFGKDYLSGPRKDFGSEKETAQYRAELIRNYIPVAVEGGTWGWGPDFPRIDGQGSIDNEFLWCWMLQGLVGVSMLLLLMGETFLVLVMKATWAGTVRDRHFLITILAIMAGLAFTLTTVFMGDQSYVLFFLLVGWAQGTSAARFNQVEVDNEELYRLEDKAPPLHAFM